MKRAAKIIARKGKPSRKATATATNQTVRFSELPPGDPRLKRLAETMDEYLDAKAAAERARAEAEVMAERTQRQTFTLTPERARELNGEATHLAMMFGAVNRLAMWAADSDHDDRNAAAMGLEAISFMGSIRADYLAHAIDGNFGAGIYEADLEKYARALGMVRKGADHDR